MNQPSQSFILDQFQVQRYSTLGSTQDEIIRQLSNGLIKTPTVILADQQKSGRGRSKGKGTTSPWYSPPGNLYISIAVPMEVERIMPLLNFIPILALNETLTDLVQRSFHLKWPNDLYFEKYKIAGILLQAKANWLICGLGCNINQASFPLDISATATSLCQITNLSFDISKILPALLKHWSYWWQVYQDSPTDLIKAWKQNDSTLGKSVQITTLDGHVQSGQATDLTEDGFLVLSTDSGDIVVNEGTLRYIG